MVISAEALKKYWEENPDRLAEAIKNNPAAFGFSAPAPTPAPTPQPTPQPTAIDQIRAGVEDQKQQLRLLSEPERNKNVGPSQEVLGRPVQSAIGATEDTLMVPNQTEGLLTVPQVLNQAVASGEPLVEQTGDERFRIADLGIGVNDQYVARLQNMGLLPESELGFEAHRTNKDGTISISPREPEANPFIEAAFKQVLPSIVAGGATTGLLGAFAPSLSSGTSLLSTAGRGAIQGAAGSLATGGGSEDILLSALTGGVTGALPSIPGVGDALQAQNLVGAFARGAVNDTVSQLIMDGSLSVEDALKAGLIQSGTETLGDLFGDVRQTNDGNLIEGVDTVNGVPMTADDVARLTNTSDLYGLLGEEGLLSKLGIDAGYIPTGFLGDSFDFIDNITGGLFGLGSRPMEGDVTGLAEEAQARIDELSDDLPLDLKEEAIAQIKADFLRQTSRYDERFFDLFTERSGSSNLTGIYELNPVARNSSLFSIGTPTTPPSSGSTPPTDQSVALNTNITPIVDDVFGLSPLEEDDDLLGTQGPVYDVFEEDEPLKSAPIEETTTQQPVVNPPELGDNTTETPGDTTTTLPTQEIVTDLPAVESPDELQVVEAIEELPETVPVSEVSGSQATAERLLKDPAEIEDNLFRLARIMSIYEMTDKQRMSAAMVMRDLLAAKESALAGDATATLDPRTTRYLQLVAEEEEEKEKSKLKETGES